jgi:hypothetical protein
LRTTRTQTAIQFTLAKSDIARTPVTRHVKIRGEANPYDPEWEQYFEHRLGVQMSRTLMGRRELLFLWKEQKGVCPICQERITRITGWHAHHITWRSRGGSDGLTIVCSSIQTVTDGSTVRDSPYRSRVRQRTFERLERPDAKVSQAVLRGGGGGNAASLPDRYCEWGVCRVSLAVTLRLAGAR